MVYQPFVEGTVVSDSPKQAHRGVCVGIYQSWNQNVFRQDCFRDRDRFARRLPLCCWRECRDAISLKNHRVVPVHFAFGLDWDDPASMYRV